MGLQEELEYYLKLYGITKTHMAKILNIHIQQISAKGANVFHLPCLGYCK